MRHSNIALGFFQNSQTADAVVSDLKEHGLYSFATIQHRIDGTISVNRNYPWGPLAKTLAAFLIVIGLGFLGGPIPPLIALILAGASLLGTFVYFFRQMISREVINRFKNRVTVDEILLIAEVRSKKARDVLGILRQVRMGHPVSFLLRSELLEEGSSHVTFFSEPLTNEQLRERAVDLAKTLTKTVEGKSSEAPLLARLNQCEKILKFLRKDVAEAEHIEQTVTVSAEWLLDNMYLIEGSIEDVRMHLPKRFYQELPVITEGPLTGLPRIYSIAIELVNGMAGRLNRESIIDFLNSYQTIQPLTIGELWALPLMLRFRLVEWIQLLAIHVDNRMRGGELAGFWGNRLLHMSRREPHRLAALFAELSQEQPAPSFHFAEELLEHLFDEEGILPHVRQWLEQRLSIPIGEVIHQEQVQETAEQVAFSNSVVSLIALSQWAWPEIFEATSIVEQTLRQDPYGAYANMNFATRNSYRDVVERLAKTSRFSEVKVAEMALQISLQAKSDVERHVGYCLIDKGLEGLEQAVGYKPNFIRRFRRGMHRHPLITYFCPIAVIATALEAGALCVLQYQEFSLPMLVLLGGLLIFPVSEVAIQIVNFLISWILPPKALPKLYFKEGIPHEFRTLIVIPTMLSSPQSIQDELSRLEVRYLANTDASLCFSLFSDFRDAPQQIMEEDAALLDIAVQGMNALDQKYGPGKFFLFHRQRLWCPSENAWIGWERKRGKLECLNRFLLDAQPTENIVYAGQSDTLRDVRFVLTLDADTQLPKGSAQELIETIAHPLNSPILAPDGRSVKRGYTIIQPLVSTEFAHTKASWFARLFAEPSALDPYSQAISNIYQDLVGDGTYYGKGIYDVRAFHSVLLERYPDAHLLSHDLLEGTFVRVGFASNVHLLDSHPEDYLSWSTRQWRWIRGDLQIIDWLFPKVPLRNGQKEDNPLTFFNRWKIFDNIRRCFLPVSLMLLLLISWFDVRLAACITGFVTFVLFLPVVSLVITKLFTFSLIAIPFAINDFLASLGRALVKISLLPHEAWMTIDASARVLYRRLISHRNLLQWITPGYGTRVNKQMHTRFLLRMCCISIFAAVILAFAPSWIYAAPYCFAWLLCPVVLYFLDKPRVMQPDKNLSEDDKAFLRQLARRTWRYFDDFVGPHSHWLPPDNFQAALKMEVAQRTSPTNIGLWLQAVTNAYDFRFVTVDTVIDKISNTIQELDKLERYEGHFLNWYHTGTLDPLLPRYISTVDSGNLLACFWTLSQTLEEIASAPILPLNALDGIRDTLEILLPQVNNENLRPLIEHLHDLAATHRHSIQEVIATIHMITVHSQELIVDVEKLGSEPIYWLQQVISQADQWDLLIQRYLSWVNDGAPITQSPSLLSLASEDDKAQWYAGEQLHRIRAIIQKLEIYSSEINLEFLYSEERKLFAIGYNIEDKRRDTSFYDLLASEARLSSLVAIAKESAPLEHWWSLGRSYAKIGRHRILLSWGGSLFEYLMPLIFNKQFPDSLLGQACCDVVRYQMVYCERRGIPWGISEAAFSAIDAHKIYQYRGFGVPGIGLKRGLENDLVVSPYSSALALAVNAPAAVANLRKLANELLGTYGLYESIDYTRQRAPTGERGVTVYAYMAHHQGMIFSTLNNVLNDNIIPRRFHNDPRIEGVEALLYERIPTIKPVKVHAVRRDTPTQRLKPFSVNPVMGEVDTPHSTMPKISLLSNGRYGIMVTNAGGGYSRWKDYDISRWRSDPTRDAYGTFFYIKDTRSGDFWSAMHHPCGFKSKHFAVSFKADHAQFKRRDHEIETTTQVVVSPEDDVEVWTLTFVNHSSRVRHLEITSYVELALAPHAADLAHQAFNKLFIETEALPNGLLAFRRLRAEDEQPLYAAHVVAGGVDAPLEYDTDRAKFIGRGRDVANPQAMHQGSSNTSGTVLDPIFSLRKSIILAPGARTKIAFIVGITDRRDSAIGLVEKYKDIGASARAIELAWTYAQLELRHLRIHQEDVQLYQKLASRVLYPHLQLRCSSERLQSNRQGYTRLWAYGISGDLPIVVVTVGDSYDIDVVRQVLIAHSFWGLRGLKVDLIIINDEVGSYEHPLQDSLHRLTQAHVNRSLLEKPGGVFVRSSEQLPPDDLNLIFCSATAVLVAARGTLRQQLVSPMAPTNYPRNLTFKKALHDYPSQPLPFMELMHFNDFGGFSKEGHEYVIYLGSDTNTPAPWINVMANDQFGCMVAESGLGCTWFGNSQSYRLTPWSNDPVSNAISDAIYIRDDDLGSIWTPTPNPVRELDAYRVTHGKGYSYFEHNSHGIEQHLSVVVAKDLPVRIQVLRLKNASPKKRRLTITAYNEWVLGTNRETTQMHVITEWDQTAQSLFAFNRFHADFGERVGFSGSIPPSESYTGDRTEFLGRNCSAKYPEALQRAALGNRVGGGLDPCGAIQVTIDLEADEQRELVFFLGSAANVTEARDLIQKCREPGVVPALQSSSIGSWKDLSESIQVEIPDTTAGYFLNHWLLYQTLSSRFWGRTGFYQSSGAYGFRDQLQDSMAFVYSKPELTRDHLLKAASRQFIEGDVQHWWHPPSGAGMRTRITDDLLWLPYVAAFYVRVTGDTGVLQEMVPFLEGPLLTEGQHEVYQTPRITGEMGTLLEHCRRAVARSLAVGPHGLPLIGCGDWNDGMNRVGIQGRGESVWLAWFLIQVMHDFAYLLESAGKPEPVWVEKARRIAQIVEETAWDGEWYRRAYFDDGTPIGSREGKEATIDSIAQSWAVICGLGNVERCDRALQSAEKHLVKWDEKLVLLLTPPFDKSAKDPGYIKGYPPGVRENGGQYSHGSIWLPLAFARRGDGDKAVALLQAMLPANHAMNGAQADHYKVEPYVAVGDVYDLAGNVGRGGWSWYTGSAGWMYRIWIEEVLGFKKLGDKLVIKPTIPKHWDSYKIHYRYGSSFYHIYVENPNHVSTGQSHEFPLIDDGQHHEIHVTLNNG